MAAEPKGAAAVKSAAVYGLFAEGKIPELIGDAAVDGPFFTKDAECTWNGDKGKEVCVGFQGYAATVLSRVPEEWPTLKLGPPMPKTELLIDAGNKCLWRHQATTDNGMDTFFNHYFEVNEAGLICRFQAMDDGVNMGKHSLKPSTAEPSVLAGPMDTPLAPVDPKGAAALKSATVYGLFAEGKVGEIIGDVAVDGPFYTKDAECIWYGDKGKEVCVGFQGYAATVLSRVPEEWPTFKLGPPMPKSELLIDAGNKCLWRLQATTDNGMDTFFNHYWEMNEAGLICRFHAIDDGANMGKYSLKNKSMPKPDDPKLEPAPEGSVEIKVSTKKPPNFYARAVQSFLKGVEAKPAEEEKDGKKAREAQDAKPPVDNLRISGLGDAVNVAVSAATQAVADGCCTITRIQTAYPSMAGSGRGCGQVLIDVKRK